MLKCNKVLNVLDNIAPLWTKALFPSFPSLVFNWKYYTFIIECLTRVTGNLTSIIWYVGFVVFLIICFTIAVLHSIVVFNFFKWKWTGPPKKEKEIKKLIFLFYQDNLLLTAFMKNVREVMSKCIVQLRGSS